MSNADKPTKKEIIIQNIVLMGITLLLNGCASILVGDKQEVKIDSDPQGVEVSVDGVFLGETPISAVINKQKESVISFSKEGYQNSSAALETKITPAFWGNILLGGAFGSTTDYSTSAMYEYEQNEYFVTLNPTNENIARSI